LGRDGAGYGFDLGEAGRNIFLQMGLDRHLAKQPVGQIGRLIRGRTDRKIESRHAVRLSEVADSPLASTD
jgi:hypothetical protein